MIKETISFLQWQETKFKSLRSSLELWLMGKLNRDIYLLGTGIKGFSHITLETNYILKNCNEVYYVNPVHSLEAYLKKINSKSFNLIGLYKDFMKK